MLHRGRARADPGHLPQAVRQRPHVRAGVPRLLRGDGRGRRLRRGVHEDGRRAAGSTTSTCNPGHPVYVVFDIGSSRHALRRHQLDRVPVVSTTSSSSTTAVRATARRCPSTSTILRDEALLPPDRAIILPWDGGAPREGGEHHAGRHDARRSSRNVAVLAKRNKVWKMPELQAG